MTALPMLADPAVCTCRPVLVAHFVLADDLMREITAQSYPPPRLGEPVMSGDLLTFGTPGEGMGQLTYRLAGRNDQGWHVAHREPDHPQP